MGLVGYPSDTQVDDDSSGTTGTPWNKAFSEAAKASIENEVVSATNPTVKPKAITDEVVAARGSKPTLDARLDVALNEDGTPKPAAGQATETQVVSFAHGNWIENDTFLIWPEGDVAAPAGYTLDGAGGTIARCGTGLQDSNTKVGPMCAKVTRAAVDVTLSQFLLNATSFAANGLCLRGRTFAFGCWVKCSVASAARVRLYEGAGSGISMATAYHTGGGAWEFLSAVHLLTGSCAELTLILEMKNSSGDAYFSGATALPGLIALTEWIPCPVVYGALTFKKGGTLVAGIGLDRFVPGRPLLVKDVQLTCLTAPTGQAIEVDINMWDGAAWQSMFTTRPEIAATTTAGAAVPDGTYRHRCNCGWRGLNNKALTWDIDQVGSGVAGADLLVSIRAMQYARPQEALLDVADF